MDLRTDSPLLSQYRPQPGVYDEMLAPDREVRVHWRYLAEALGSLGLAARAWCLRNRRGFTTSYHTRFPEYLRMRAPVPLSFSYALMRWFHRPPKGMMVATRSMREELTKRGFDNVAKWSRDVYTHVFKPGRKYRYSNSAYVFKPGFIGKIEIFI